MNKTRKALLLSLLLISVVLISIFSVSVNAAESTELDGMSFSKTDYFVQEETIESISGNLTLESEIWMNPNGSYGSNKAYVVFGSYADSRGEGFNLLIRSPGTSTANKNKLLVELYDRRIVNGSNKNTTVLFTGMDLKQCFGTEENPTYCKILVNIDVSAKNATLYLNYKDTNGNDATYQETIKPTTWHSDAYTGSDFPFVIGGDQRTGNSAYFVGKTKSVAMYSGISTTAGTTAGLDPMFKYDLTDTSVEGYLADLSGNSIDAMHPTLFDESLKYDYSFAIVGDTQYMTRWDVIKTNGEVSETEHLKKVYDWLLENKEKKNIQYVMGLGDITDSYDKTYEKYTSDTAAEWAWAYSQISRLDGNIPYSVVRGNHDNEMYFDSYFVNDTYQNQFKDSDGYSCFYSEDSVRNAYTKFEVGTEKYLLLLLDDNPTDPVLEWANEVVSRNPDYRVIINTHTYLAYTGDHVDDSETYAYATMNLYEGENNGVQIWEKLVSKHENIVLVLCGHDQKCGGEIIRTVRIGENGNAVNEVIVCPQSLDGNEARDTKAGMVAMLYFSNGGKDVRVEYVSTALTYESENGKDVYHKPEVNNITFSLMTLPTETKHGYIPSEYLDVDKYPVAVFSDTNVFLGAYDSVFDITNPYNDSGAIYKAKTMLDVNSWNGTSFSNIPKSATIVLRKDYSFKSNESYNNTSFIKGVVKIDLNGFVLTANDAKSPLGATIKPLNSTTTIPTEIDFINGTIELSAKPLISLSASGGSGNLDISQKPFTFEFSNIEFKASATATDIFATYSSSINANPNITLNNCTFDLSEAPSGAVLFNLGNGYVNTLLTVNGGKFISNASCDYVMSKNAYSASSLVFGKNTAGNYSEFTISKGMTLPVINDNNGELVFIKVSEDGTTETYRLSAPISFIPKTSITLGSELVYNVYVPADYLKSFTVDGKTYTDAEIVTLGDGKQYYHVSIQMPASEAARSIVLKATITVDGKDFNGTWTMSIPKYSTKVLASDANVTEKTLVKDVLAYIKAAYIYFDADDKTEVAETIDAILGDYNNTFAKVEGTTDVDDGLWGVVIVLEEKPAVRFVLPEGVTADGYTFKVGNTVLDFTTGTMTVEDKTYNYAEVSLYAYQMIREITYTNGTVSGCYHINSYYDYVTTDNELKNNANLISLVEKLYNYCKSAEAYRASVTNK